MHIYEYIYIYLIAYGLPPPCLRAHRFRSKILQKFIPRGLKILPKSIPRGFLESQELPRAPKSQITSQK